MGQYQSKALGSKVYNSPDFAVAKDLRSDLESDTTTDFTRLVLSEKEIESRVAQRLYEEHVEADKQLKESQIQIQDIKDDRLGGFDTRELRKKVSALHQELTTRPLRGELDKDGKAAREKLVECLEQHKQQPLKCRETFAEFQKEVTRVEQSIAQQ